MSEQEVSFFASLKRIIFRNESNGFSVLLMVSEDSLPSGDLDRGEDVCCTGLALTAQEGLRYKVTGKFVDHPQYGLQVQLSSLVVEELADKTAIERFLSSGLIAGIGEDLAHRIVKKFGERTADIIEESPEKLLRVKGIGKQVLQGLIESWNEHKHLREYMEFLQMHGISIAIGKRIYAAYQEDALDVLRTDPYRIALDVEQIGFVKADEIAKKLGVGEEDFHRLCAGLIHVLKTATNDGDVFLFVDELLTRAKAMLKFGGDALLEKALRQLVKEELCVVEECPELEGKRAVYLAWLHHYERQIAWYLKEILRVSPRVQLENKNSAVEEVAQRFHPRLDEKQVKALRAAVDSKLLILTGGPGTGKTTIIKAILRIFEDVTDKILLAAPTGRAAKRMSETSEREAKTIHRLLEYVPDEERFSRDEENPLNCDLLIIDEASMIDLSLFYHLVKAIPVTSRVILVGDVFQLPSVGPGTVLADLINSHIISVERLTEIYRQRLGMNGKSDIILASQAVNEGKMPNFSHPEGHQPDIYFMPTSSQEETANLVVELVSKRLVKHFRFDPLADIQVLTPMHKGKAGTEGLNKRLQDALNPCFVPTPTSKAEKKQLTKEEEESWIIEAKKEAKAIDHPEDARIEEDDDFEHRKGYEISRDQVVFRVGDKVMQTKNNYEYDVFNGDMGIVDGVEKNGKALSVIFDKYKKVIFNGIEMNDIVPAYAISIHKSQGSEYKAVVITLMRSHWPMLQRNLIYTAITRGKDLVVLVGQYSALERAVENNDVYARHTRLLWRLQEAIPQRHFEE